MTNNTDIKLSYSLHDAIDIVDKEPKLPMIYSGIKKGSVGIVFGPSKSGKTTYCEALGMHLACGATEFLGKPIHTPELKVQFISLEEHYTNRIERNKKQAENLKKTYGDSWLKHNYKVTKDEIPSFIYNKEDWELLENAINESQAEVVFIDSLTRLYTGSIEESSIAKNVMKQLLELASNTGTTIICIHHTTKLYDRPISMDTIAGSRVIASDSEFMLGINRTPTGKRYIKEVAFRYVPTDDEYVYTFDINEDNLIEVVSKTYEQKLLAPRDERSNSEAVGAVNKFISENYDFTIDQLKEKYMKFNDSRQAFSAYKKRLIKRGVITEDKNGKYKAA